MKHIRACWWIVILIFVTSPVIPRDVEVRSPVILSGPGMVGTASVVFSPNGRYIATAPDGNGAFRLWDAKTLAVIKVLDATPSALKYAIAFSPDSGLAAGGVGDEIVIWETATGKQLKRFTGHKDARIYALSFTPDGKSLVSAGCDTNPKMRGRVWNTADWTLRYGLWYDFNYPCLRTLAISPDGRHVLLGGGSDGAGDHPALKYDIATGAKAGEIIVTRKSEDFFNDAMISGIYYSPDGSRVAAITQSFFKIFDAASGKELTRINAEKKIGHSFRYACFSPDSKSIALLLRASSRDWRIFIVYARNGGIIRTFTASAGDKRYYYNLSFTHDGKYLALVGTRDTIDFYRWD